MSPGRENPFFIQPQLEGEAVTLEFGVFITPRFSLSLGTGYSRNKIDGQKSPFPTIRLHLLRIKRMTIFLTRLKIRILMTDFFQTLK